MTANDDELGLEFVEQGFHGRPRRVGPEYHGPPARLGQRHRGYDQAEVVALSLGGEGEADGPVGDVGGEVLDEQRPESAGGDVLSRDVPGRRAPIIAEAVEQGDHDGVECGERGPPLQRGGNERSDSACVEAVHRSPQLATDEVDIVLLERVALRS